MCIPIWVFGSPFNGLKLFPSAYFLSSHMRAMPMFYWSMITIMNLNGQSGLLTPVAFKCIDFA